MRFVYAILVICFSQTLTSQPIPEQILNCQITKSIYNCDCLERTLINKGDYDLYAHANYFFALKCVKDLKLKKAHYRIARENWDKVGYAGYRYLNIYFNVIEHYYKIQVNTDSVKYYVDKALSVPVVKNPQFVRSLANILRYKAWLARASGDSQFAYELFENFEKSDEFSYLPDKSKAWFYYNFADVLIDIPNVEYHNLSKELHLKSLELTRDLDLYLYNIYGLGRFYEKKDSFDNALEKYREYHKTLEKYEAFSDMATSANSIGNVYRELNKPDQALLWYQQSINFSKIDTTISEFEHSPYVNLSKIYRNMGEYVNSISVINKAIETIYDSKSNYEDLLFIKDENLKYPLAHLELLNEIGYTLSLASKSKKDDELALAYYQKGFDYFHQQFDNATFNRSKYQKKLDFRNLFQNLIAHTIKIGDMEHVFNILDLGKHSILGYEMQKKTDVFDVAPSNDNGNKLEKNQAVIQYGSTADSIIAVVNLNDNYSYYNLGGLSEINSLIHEYIRLLRNVDNISKTSDRFYNISHELYNLLIKPFALNVKSIKIVPDEALSLLPFESLITDGDDNQSFLIKQYPISYSLSLQLDRILEANKTKVSGVSTFTPQFDRNPSGNNSSIERGTDARDIKLFDLKYSREETSSIVNLMGGKDKAVNRINIFNSMLSDKILHYSGHAVNLFDNAEFSYLAFSSNIEIDSNKLTLNDISQAICNNEMVVLSACDTGTGEVVIGEGVLSLGRGFFQAGAKSVVSTLWSVNDHSSSIIMKEFYRHLKQGKSKDQALQLSKLKYLEQRDEKIIHPYYWAGFIAYGDMQKINVNNIIHKVYILCAILLILTLIFVKLNF